MNDTESDSSLSDEGVMVAELMFATPRDSSKSTFVGKTPPSKEKMDFQDRKKTVKPIGHEERKDSSNITKSGST